MNRFRKMFILGIMLLLTLAFAATAKAGALGQGVVIDEDRLNIRSGPGTEYSIVGSLYYGNIVELEDENDGWYFVSRRGAGRGWCSAKLILAIEPMRSYGHINAPDSNMRGGPSKDSSLLGVFANGEEVYVSGHVSGWYRVQRSSGQWGWVFDGYVNL